jgi:beta-glucanase (GH16 family)
MFRPFLNLFAASLMWVLFLTGATASSSSNGWILIFDEEFNGTSLDLTKWWPNWLGAKQNTVTQPVNPTAETAAYDPAQCTVSGGYLNLTTVSNPITINGTTYPYRTCLIETYPTFNYLYGYAEARINVPVSSNSAVNWPAFWMDGVGTWPYAGEFDVLEGIKGSIISTFHNEISGATGYYSTPPTAFSAGNFTGGWHVYGLYWEPNLIKFYYDGVLINSLTNATTGYNGTFGSGVTNSQVYVIFDNAMGGSGGVTAVGSTMLIDWLHVYTESAQFNSPEATIWLPRTSYASGNMVIAGSNVYTETARKCTSASSGNGPQGTAKGITDGTCTWNYLSTSAIPKGVTPEAGYTGMAYQPE